MRRTLASDRTRHPHKPVASPPWSVRLEKHGRLVDAVLDVRDTRSSDLGSDAEPRRHAAVDECVR